MRGSFHSDKYRDRIEISNPGCLLISFEQLLAGGISECRNKCLQTMFQMIGRGEKAGSGYDKIRLGWKAQRWLPPSIRETVQPDRVRLVLPMVSFLPEESISRLKTRFSWCWEGLSADEVQALVIAEIEGSVANARLRTLSDQHPADLTRMLQGLVGKGLLRQVGQKRGTFYRLPPAGRSDEGARNSPHTELDSPHTELDSPHNEDARAGSGQDTLFGVTPSGLASEPAMQAIAAPARKKKRMSPERMREIIREICKGRYVAVQDLGSLLHRDPKGLQSRYLTPMCREGLLSMRFPEKPNRPDQAYTSAERTGR